MWLWVSGVRGMVKGIRGRESRCRALTAWQRCRSGTRRKGRTRNGQGIAWVS